MELRRAQALRTSPRKGEVTLAWFFSRLIGLDSMLSSILYCLGQIYFSMPKNVSLCRIWFWVFLYCESSTLRI